MDPWDPLMLEYHDREWGTPVHDDRTLFEFLVLEGNQAGLSWLIILRKRENYRKAFADFDPAKVARFDAAKVRKLLADPGIVRNRRKVEAAIQNAKAFLRVQKEFGSFDAYLWSFVDGKPLRNGFTSFSQVPNVRPEAERLSKDLLSRGFKFVGPTIINSYMQAVGLINDHLRFCFRYSQKS